MPRFILEYYKTDGCTYSCNVTIPFNYFSADQFLFDIELLWEKFRDERHEYFMLRQVSAIKSPLTELNMPSSEFKLEGFKNPIDILDFVEEGIFYPPEIKTLEEWFSENSET